MRSTIGTAIPAALLAAKFAQSLRLPPGNFREPVVSKKIAVELETAEIEDVKNAWQIRLGILPPDSAT